MPINRIRRARYPPSRSAGAFAGARKTRELPQDGFEFNAGGRFSLVIRMGRVDDNVRRGGRISEIIRPRFSGRARTDDIMSHIPDRVLVVDDDYPMRLLVSTGLAQRGFAVTEAVDGAAALERFGVERPDIVLLDAEMPGMSGFEACKAMRALPEGEHVPIVMLTGLDDDASIARAYEAGATDFYVKSSQMTLLAERVRYLLRTARMSAELARNRARLAKAQRMARLGTWDWDLARRTVSASTESLRILGLPGREETVPEEEFVRRFYADGVDAFRFEVLTSLKAGRVHRFAGTVQLPDEAHPIEIEMDAERDAGAIVRVNGTLQDVTERRRAEEQVRRLANFDSLTGLANRNLFRSRLEEALADSLRRKQCLAVLMIGLDRFKQVNDSLGQAAGDALLREAAARLNRSARNRDAVARAWADSENSALARLGGDEFALILFDLKERAEAGRSAECALDALREPFLIDGNECWVTASIGIAVSPEDADSAEQLLLRADAAMRKAKAGGHDTYRFYEAARGPASADRLRMEADLRRAIERDELRLHWQPIVNVDSGRVSGAEVLLRWQREDRLVSPAEFIPLAEQTGIIVSMGEWVLETACRQLSAWRRDGLEPICVGVNLAASHVQQRDVQRQVRDTLIAHGLAPEVLSLEITESLLMDFAEPTLRGLAALRELGVHIAMDDFGTGYSSLSYLKRLPVTTLKIDRSFVVDVADDADGGAIVSAITGLARSLLLLVVAEGVETVAQRNALRAHGVTTMQGYLFSKPLPVAEFDKLLRDANASRRSPSSGFETSKFRAGE